MAGSISEVAGRRGRFTGRVVRNERICTDHHRLVLEVAGFPESVPGQFAQIECGPVEPVGGLLTEGPREVEWHVGMRLGDADFVEARPFLRRPFSIAGQRALAGGGAEVHFIHRVIGRGTGYLARLAAGETVSLLGPLGNGFGVPEDLELALLVGGGVGVPPMLYLAEVLARKGKKAVAFVGAQRRDLLPVGVVGEASAAGDPGRVVKEFSELGFETAICTDNGSCGMQGFVTGALKRYLQRHPFGARKHTVVYCCGPTPMMKATAAVAAESGVACQVSLEQPMACGMGTCQSCVIKYQPAGASEWVYKLTCTDGPVFDARDIRW